MRIAPLLALFFAAVWLSAAGAQPPPESKSAQPIDVSLRAPGEWTPTNINVAAGDSLVFRFRPDRRTLAMLEEYGAVATYEMQIGDHTEPVVNTVEYRVPVSGSLALRVDFSRRERSRSFSSAVMATILHRPRPPEPEEPPVPTPVDVEIIVVGRPMVDFPYPPERGPYPKDEPRQTQQEDWTWLVLPVGGGLAAVFILGLVIWYLRKRPIPVPPVPPDMVEQPPAPPPPPAVPPTIVLSPTLDPGEGRFAGDEVAPADPEIRFGATLEPGETRYDSGEPLIEREEPDGGA